MFCVGLMGDETKKRPVDKNLASFEKDLPRHPRVHIKEVVQNTESDIETFGDRDPFWKKFLKGNAERD